MVASPKSVLFVEGEDELKFINFFLRKLWNLPRKEMEEVVGSFYVEEAKLEAFDIKGIDKFESYFRKSLPSHVYSAEKIAIIVDADARSPEGTLDYMNAALQMLEKSFLKNSSQEDLNIILPSQVGVFSEGKPQIGIFVLPNNKDNGTLENLCLSIAYEADLERLDHTHNFYGSIQTLADLPAEMKLKMQVFLATKKDGNTKTTRGIGMAAQNGHWNFDHTNLTPLKNFLNDLKKITHHA